MTPQHWTPRPYQSLIVGHQVDVDRNAAWAGMGMGKTVSTLSSLDALYLVGEESRPALVLAPLRVAQSTWPDEARKWDHLRHIEVQPVVGEKLQREAALRNPNASVFTSNYDNLPWLVNHLRNTGRLDMFGTIILDEATRVKSFRGSVQKSKKGNEFVRKVGGVRARALVALNAAARRTWQLTGTPSPNGLLDLWGQVWFLDQGQRLGRTFSGFSQRWFRPAENGYGSVPLPFAQEQIQDRLRDICLSIEAKDWFDLREPIKNVVRVKLTGRARALYRDMEREMFMQLEGHDVEAFNGAAKTIKCLQLANGAAYVDENATKWVEVHDAKIQALESIITEASGAPVLVAYHFQADLARLRRAFPKGRTLDADPQTIRDWNEGRIPILFAHPASAGHGLNLQDGGHILAFFGLWWDLEQHLQIIERIGPTRQAQAGHDRAVFIHYIVAEGTVDELVLDRLESKRSVQDILMDAMKRSQK